MTEWKPIPGYEDYYEVSNDGQVKSIDRVITRRDGVRVSYTGRIRIPSVNAKGYLRLNLCDGRNKQKDIHRLVAESFVDGRTEERNQVNHINGIKTDNRACNLEWVTNRQNINHAVENNLTANKHGEKNPNAKLTQEDVNDIRDRFAEGNITYKELGDEYNIHYGTVSKIIKRKLWRKS